MHPLVAHKTGRSSNAERHYYLLARDPVDLFSFLLVYNCQITKCIKQEPPQNSYSAFFIRCIIRTVDGTVLHQ
jgi:hypothetical protein